MVQILVWTVYVRVSVPVSALVAIPASQRQRPSLDLDPGVPGSTDTVHTNVYDSVWADGYTSVDPFPDTTTDGG